METASPAASATASTDAGTVFLHNAVGHAVDVHAFTRPLVPNRADPSVTRITEVTRRPQIIYQWNLLAPTACSCDRGSRWEVFTEIIGIKLNLGYKNIDDLKHEKEMPPENTAIKLKRDVANCEVDLKTANASVQPYWSIRNAEQATRIAPRVWWRRYPESFYELCAGTYKKGWADFTRGRSHTGSHNGPQM